MSVWCGVVWCGVVWCGVCVCACACSCVCVCVWGGGGRCDCVYGWVGVSLFAVNRGALEGMNINNDCALISEAMFYDVSLRFIPFYFICIVYHCYVELSTCPVRLCNLSDPIGKFSFYTFIMSKKVILYFAFVLIRLNPFAVQSVKFSG